MSLKDFQFLGKLGEGAFSSVYKVKRLIDDEIYAIKKVKMNNLTERERQNSLNEVRILASITNPHIVAYKEAFIDKSTNFLQQFCLIQLVSIVMEFAEQGDLYAAINKHIKHNTKFTQTQAWSIFIQVTKGLRVLHELRILHRDLKSANVFLFKNGIVKLGDMNVSKLAKSMCKTQTGTPYYASPQVWKDLPYDKKSDIWSLGCILYEALSLKPPFRANSMEELFKKVTRGFYPRIPAQYSDQLSNVLKMMLQVTTHLRPTCDKLLELPIVMKHLQSLPSQLQIGNEKVKGGNPKQQLLRTIRISKDNKSNPGYSPLPRPRYLSSLQLQQQQQKQKQQQQQNLTNLQQQQVTHKNHKHLKQRSNSSNNVGIGVGVEIGAFPSINNNSLKDDSQQNNNDVIKWNAQNEIVKKVIGKQDQKDKGSKSLHLKAKRQHVSLLNTPLNKQYQIRSDKKIDADVDIVSSLKKQSDKLPSIYQGRLKSISPELLKKIIKREKQKNKLYSIIDKKF